MPRDSLFALATLPNKAIASLVFILLIIGIRLLLVKWLYLEAFAGRN